MLTRIKYYIKEKGVLAICITVILLVLSVGALYMKQTYVNPKDKAEIITQIESIQGEPVIIERANPFKTAPFFHTRYARVYKFTYTKEGKQITGWANFDLIDKWIMNENEN